MSDVECPYCGTGQEICHDDGYGYTEDEVFEQLCYDCDKYFSFTTSIHFSYKAHKADCLNGASHKYKPTSTYPKNHTKMVCADCGDQRPCTDDEMAEVLRHD